MGESHLVILETLYVNGHRGGGDLLFLDSFNPQTNSSSLHELFLNATETKAVAVFFLLVEVFPVEEVFPKLTVFFFF